MYYFFICARLELFCDFLQSDWLHERAAFYDILASGPGELFYETNPGVKAHQAKPHSAILMEKNKPN